MLQFRFKKTQSEINSKALMYYLKTLTTMPFPAEQTLEIEITQTSTDEWIDISGYTKNDIKMLKELYEDANKS